MADDPVGRRLPGRGDRGHPAVPLRSPPRETPAHLGVLGTRLTVQKAASSLTHDCDSEMTRADALGHILVVVQLIKVLVCLRIS